MGQVPKATYFQINIKRAAKPGVLVKGRNFRSDYLKTRGFGNLILFFFFLNNERHVSVKVGTLFSFFGTDLLTRSKISIDINPIQQNLTQH